MCGIGPCSASLHEAATASVPAAFCPPPTAPHEAPAYFVEDKTVNLVVLNSRNEKEFKAALPAFEELAKSYLFIAEKVDIKKAPAEKKPAAKKAPEKTGK